MMAQVKEHIKSYIEQVGQSAQNNFMLYNCLGASDTMAAKCKINLQQEKFHHNGHNGISIGALVLKAIIEIAYIDTHSTTMQLCMHLSLLNTYMSDIQQLYIHENIDWPTAHGKCSLNVITYLFKGYKACIDSKLHHIH